MIRYNYKLPTFSTVGAGQTATLTLPLGPTYRGLVLKYEAGGVNAAEADMKADIKRVALKVNGTERYVATAKQLIDIQTKFYGNSVVAGMLFFPFTRDWLATIAGQDNLALGTNNVASLQLEVDIASGATTPKLTAFADVEDVPRDFGAMVEGHTYNYYAAGAQVFEISDLPKSLGDIVGLHINSAYIDGVELTINNRKVFDADLDVYKAVLKRKPSERVPQADWFHMDPLKLNRMGDVLPMRVQDFRLKVTTSQATELPVFVETLNAPLGLNGGR